MTAMPQSVLILGFNLFPALSAILFGWSAFTLMLLYWIENLIIGGINALKIVISGAARGRRKLISTFLLALFFVLHYALFCAIHGVILFSLFDRGTVDVDLFNLPSQVRVRLETEPMLFWNAVVLAVFHLGSFLIYWVARGACRESDPVGQMFAPYSRIVLVHVTLMLAAAPVILLGQPLIGVVLLALVKTAIETGVVHWNDLSAGEAGGPTRLAARSRNWTVPPRG